MFNKEGHDDIEGKNKKISINPTFLTEIELLEDNNDKFKNETITTNHKIHEESKETFDNEEIDEPKLVKSAPIETTRVLTPKQDLPLPDEALLETENISLFVLCFAVYIIFTVLQLKLSQLLNLWK